MRRQFLWRWCKRATAAALLVVFAGAVVFAVCWVRYPFPEERLEPWAQSPVVTDRTGGVMLEVTGRDGQWRRAVASAGARR